MDLDIHKYHKFLFKLRETYAGIGEWTQDAKQCNVFARFTYTCLTHKFLHKRSATSQYLPFLLGFCQRAGSQSAIFHVLHRNYLSDENVLSEIFEFCGNHNEAGFTLYWDPRIVSKEERLSNLNGQCFRIRDNFNGNPRRLRSLQTSLAHAFPQVFEYYYYVNDHLLRLTVSNSRFLRCIACATLDDACILFGFLFAAGLVLLLLLM